MPDAAPAPVFRVSLDEPLAPLRVEPPHQRALLVLELDGTVIAELLVEAPGGALDAEAQRAAIEREAGDLVASHRLRLAFTAAARSAAVIPVPPVTVVVDPLAGTARLRSLLASLESGTAQPEVIVLDKSGEGEAHNRAIAAAQGEVVAFLDGEFAVHDRWLDRVGDAFADPLVMAVIGYTGQDGLETRAGRLAILGRWPLPVQRWVHEWSPPPLEVPGNLFVRRAAFSELGMFAPGLSPAERMSALLSRIVAAGYRVTDDPRLIAWRPLADDPPPRTWKRGAAPAGPPAPRRVSEPPAPYVASDDDPRVSVSVASYNRREQLAHVLDALGRQTYPADRYEVLVVLDGSTDGSAERVRAMKPPHELKLIEQENRGLAASRNRGGRESSGDVIVFLDDDIVPEPEFVAEHAAAHRDASGKIVALGHYPPAERPYDDLHMIVSRRWWEDFFRRRAEPGHQWSYIDFADGNASFRRGVLEASGGWNEDFVRETVRRQDWEFAIRLIRQGVHFADRPLARGSHHFELTLEGSLRNRRVEGQADVVLGTKHPEVRGHLVLARLVATAERRRSARAILELAYRRPKVAERFVRASVPLLRALERGDRRTAWAAAYGRVTTLSYLLGVRSGLPTLAALREFMEPAREPTGRVRVDLDRARPLALETAVGQVALDLFLSDSPLATVDAFEPEGQWDWDALSERVAREALGSFRRLRPDGAR